jgi:hypothetical protein
MPLVVEAADLPGVEALTGLHSEVELQVVVFKLKFDA